MKNILFTLLAKCGLILIKTFKEELKLGSYRNTELTKRAVKIRELEKQNKMLDAQYTFLHERFKGLLRQIIDQGLKDETIGNLGRAGFELVNFTGWVRVDDYLFMEQIFESAEFIKFKEDLRLQKLEESVKKINLMLTKATPCK